MNGPCRYNACAPAGRPRSQLFAGKASSLRYVPCRASPDCVKRSWMFGRQARIDGRHGARHVRAVLALALRCVCLSQQFLINYNYISEISLPPFFTLWLRHIITNVLTIRSLFWFNPDHRPPSTMNGPFAFVSRLQPLLLQKPAHYPTGPSCGMGKVGDGTGPLIFWPPGAIIHLWIS
jgi:hypothetical protein